jgi:uncharacterized Fe-S cluster protein YjdI
MPLRMRDPQTHEYSNDEIIVTWEPALCEHAAECIRNLPEVFNSRARPWIKLSKGTPEEIARVVSLCPTTAIKYQWVNKPEPGASNDAKPAES